MSNKFFLVSFLFFISLAGKSQDTSTYKLSDLFEIRQAINASGLAYLSTPLQRSNQVEIIQDSELIFIAAYTDHLAIFNKKDNAWTIFNIANGYPFVHHPIRIQANYRDKFVLAGSKIKVADTTDFVVVFDKVTKTVSTLSLRKYLSLSPNWKLENYESKDERWYIEKDDYHTIVRHDLKNNKRIRFATHDWEIGQISSIQKLDTKVYVAYKNGIGAFDINPAVDAKYRFPLPPIKGLECSNDEILIVYDSASEIVDKNLKSRQYILLPTNTGHVSFNDKYIFYASNQTLKVKSRNTLNDTLNFNFKAGITGLKHVGAQLLVFTPVGYASIELTDFQVNHYLQSSGESKNNNDDENGNYYQWIGRLNELLVAYNEGNEQSKLVTFLKGVPKPIDPPLNSITVISGRNYLAKEDSIYKVYVVNDDYVSSKLFEFQLKEEPIPNAFQDQPDYPIGSRVITFDRLKDTFIVATDKGLFFYDRLKKKWRTHFITNVQLHAGRGLLVRDNVIYSFGETYSNAAGVISKIDRKNYKICNYSTPFHDAYYRSVKVNNDELICANQRGIVHYDFKTQKEQTSSLPEQINQVAFYNKNYLAVSVNNIYLSGKNGEVLRTWPLKHQLIDGILPSPRLIELDGDNLWINSTKSLDGQLTFFSLKKGEQIDFYFGDAYGTVKKIIPDGDYTWIFGSEHIYRYNKKTSSLYKLGIIRYPINSKPAEIAYITDAIDHDSVLYIVTHSGIFQLQKESLIIRRSTLPYLENPITNIAKDGKLYYISTTSGVFQIDAPTFESSFVGDPFTLFNYFKRDAGILLPFSYGNTVRIADKNHNQLFRFTLKTELANHSVLNDFLYPEKYLKFMVNGHELKLQGGGMNQRYPIETLFYLSIPPEVLQKGSNSLKVIDRSQQDLLLKEWELILKEN